jgi:hypothetical protein
MFTQNQFPRTCAGFLRNRVSFVPQSAFSQNQLRTFILKRKFYFLEMGYGGHALECFHVSYICNKEEYISVLYLLPCRFTYFNKIWHAGRGSSCERFKFVISAKILEISRSHLFRLLLENHSFDLT